jgi:hypothetical protein
MTSSSHIFGEKMKLTTIIKAGLHLFKLFLNLTFIWLTLDWKVWKAKKAFEKELIKSGIPKKTAKKLGKRYSSIKDEFLKELLSSVRKFKW